MRREITTLALALLLASGTATLHAQDVDTDTEEDTGQPSTLTSEDTRGGATGTGAMDDPVPIVAPTDIDPANLDRARPNMGNPEEYNDPGHWGLLGLLGLAGLLGRRRVDRGAPVARRDATSH